MLPEGSLRQLLEAVHEKCKNSPRVDCARALSIAMTIVWRQSVVLKNVSIVDILWGLTFVLSAQAYGSHEKAAVAYPGRKSLILAMTTAWGARLSTFLYWRNHISAKGIGVGTNPEDYRYQVFRRFWDSKGLSYWWFSLIQVFGLQGVLSFIVGQPLLAAQTEEQPQHYTLLDAAGAAVFAIGYYFEHCGDLELTAFKSNPLNKGKVLATGLWAFTRHPNCECTLSNHAPGTSRSVCVTKTSVDL
jgi:steroid 5-alpha reductase family enzyme